MDSVAFPEGKEEEKQLHSIGERVERRYIEWSWVKEVVRRFIFMTKVPRTKWNLFIIIYSIL